MAVPLPPAKKRAVEIGCVCMMLSVAMYGLVFATLTSPILESVDAMGYVSLFTIFASLGVCIMTPIGGKLGDLVIWDAPDLDYICYRFGSNLAKKVIKRGRVM